MKKNYVSPLATEVTFETTQMMLATSLFLSEQSVDTEAEGGQLGGGRRGSWGDVWK